MAFDEVARQDDAVRDRYAEILYRFFYGDDHRSRRSCSATPIPATTSSVADGRVAFFDFGMLRRLPADYLRREGLVSRAIRRGDAPLMLDTLHDLGYLPGPTADWDGELPARLHARGRPGGSRAPTASSPRISGAARLPSAAKPAPTT